MRRKRRVRRILLWPIVILTFGLAGGFVPRLAEGLPQTVRGRIVDEYSGLPIAGVSVTSGSLYGVSDRDGAFEIGGVGRGEMITITVAGYRPRVVPSGEATTLVLRPTTLAGGILDATDGKPIAGATVRIGDQEARTGGEGIYRLDEVTPNAVLYVKAPGYARREVRPGTTSRFDVQLTRQPIRAIWLSSATVNFAEQRDKLFELARTSEINAVVLDIKNDRGILSYPSGIAMAREIGASPDFGPDLGAIIRQLRAQGTYVIVRIVTFRDRTLATARLDLAVRLSNGQLLVDVEGNSWTDPFQPEVRSYNIAVAEEAARLGADEIQFDLLRFPTDPRVETALFAQKATPESRLDAIRLFLTAARERLRQYNVMIAVDTLGYASWNQNDLGVGQRIEQILPLVDYLSPVLFPSTFAIGVAGLGDRDTAIRAPYEVVKRSLEESKRRTKGTGMQFRPWLQYFDDYAYQTGMVYGAAEIGAQKRAAIDAGSAGWMLWDPTNLYSRGAIDPR